MELPRDFIQSKVNMKVERLGVKYINDRYTQRERNTVWHITFTKVGKHATHFIKIYLDGNNQLSLFCY